jgi:ferric-dicitrate binding protein FerR (iron transport regulator)
MITKELFEKFLQNECSEEERMQVNQYLDEHPEAIPDLLPAGEFTELQFREGTIPDVERKIYQKLEGNIFRRAAVKRMIKRTLAAASVVLIAGIGWKVLTSDGLRHGKTNGELQKASAQTDPWISYTTASNSLYVLLPDSSGLILSSFSSVKYDRSFGQNGRRAVYLSGEAEFQVAKNRAKPFTVYSADISTIVLGTSFKVNAFDNRKIISVHLHTGRVLVKPADPAENKLKLNIYLQPGDELFYNKITRLATVRKFEGHKKKPARLKSRKENIYKPDWYKFSGQRLADVLDQLSFYYQVEIDYRPDDISHSYMTAEFRVNDSLEKILKDIGLLNKLKLTEADGKYILRK